MPSIFRPRKARTVLMISKALDSRVTDFSIHSDSTYKKMSKNNSPFYLFIANVQERLGLQAAKGLL